MGQANSKSSAINKLLTWRDLILMTLAFSLPYSPTGWGPVFAIAISSILFGFSNISKEVRESVNQKGKPDITQRRAAFIGCLVTGVVMGIMSLAGIVFLGGPFLYQGDMLYISLGLAVLLAPLCLLFFISYGVSLGWWDHPSIFYVTFLSSIITAGIVGSQVGNIGINMIVSSLISSIVYGILVGETKNKKEPWMKWQAIYMGILIGGASAVGVNVLMKYVKEGQKSPEQKQAEELAKTSGIMLPTPPPSKDEEMFKKIMKGVDGASVYTWVILFIFWTLTVSKVDMPPGWDKMFIV